MVFPTFSLPDLSADCAADVLYGGSGRIKQNLETPCLRQGSTTTRTTTTHHSHLYSKVCNSTLLCVSRKSLWRRGINTHHEPLHSDNPPLHPPQLRPLHRTNTYSRPNLPSRPLRRHPRSRPLHPVIHINIHIHIQHKSLSIATPRRVPLAR